MVLKAVLAKPEVERVTVVEIDADVIGLVSPYYACGRLEVVGCYGRYRRIHQIGI